MAMQTAFTILAALCVRAFFSLARGKTRLQENGPKG
jgi:hypothetical protein